jgi:hypothetical protein
VQRQILAFLRHAVARDMGWAADAPHLDEIFDALEQHGLQDPSAPESAAYWAKHCSDVPHAEPGASTRPHATGASFTRAHLQQTRTPAPRSARRRAISHTTSPRRDLDPRLRGPPDLRLSA